MILRILAIVAVILAAAVGWRIYDTDRDLRTLAESNLGAVLGNPQGDFTIVEFMDYRCPGCRFLNPTVEKVIETYPDIRVVIRHLPLSADPAIRDSRVALAASLQGKFTEAHKRLVVRENPITDAEIEALAAELGLNLQQLKRDMLESEVNNTLLTSLTAAQKYNIQSVPSFLIDGVYYRNSQGNAIVPSYEDLVRVIEERRKSR